MKNYENKLKISLNIVIVLFVLVLIWGLYFKFGNVEESEFLARTLSYMTLKEKFMFDIIPFDFSNTHQKSLHFLLNILNMIVFIPFGVALPMRSKKINILPQALFCFCFSLIIEVTQLFTSIGGFAMDDLLMNTLGYFVGLVLYHFIFRKFSDKINFYIILSCNIILAVMLAYAIIDIIPIFDRYVEIVKTYGFICKK